MTPQEVLNILRKTDIDCSVGSFTCEQVCDCGVMWNFENFMSEHYPLVRYEIMTGATKCVIVFKDEDFVIKIPFSGYDDWEGQEYDSETGYFDEDYDPFFEFEYGDYCQLEEEIFDKALDEGLDFALARTQFIGMAGDFPVYVQEKATSFWNGKSKHSREEITLIKNQYKYDIERLDPEWILDFISCYGKRTFEAFLQFTIDAHINDLHNGNVGYIYGQPVLLDYSGYWE